MARFRVGTPVAVRNSAASYNAQLGTVTADYGDSVDVQSGDISMPAVPYSHVIRLWLRLPKS